MQMLQTVVRKKGSDGPSVYRGEMHAFLTAADRDDDRPERAVPTAGGAA